MTFLFRSLIRDSRRLRAHRAQLCLILRISSQTSLVKNMDLHRRDDSLLQAMFPVSIGCMMGSKDDHTLALASGLTVAFGPLYPSHSAVWW